MPHEHVNSVQFGGGIVLCGEDDEDAVVGAHDGLSRFRAAGKERIGNAGNDEANGAGAVPFENSGSLIGHIAQSLDGKLDAGEGLWIDTLASIDHTRYGRCSDAGLLGHFT
jgi:hypothetical protein